MLKLNLDLEFRLIHRLKSKGLRNVKFKPTSSDFPHSTVCELTVGLRRKIDKRFMVTKSENVIEFTKENRYMQEEIENHLTELKLANQNTIPCFNIQTLLLEIGI